jgi:hypothetical protein
MRMYRSTVFYLLFFVSLLSMAQALTLEEILPFKNQEILMKEGVIKVFNLADNRLSLAPAGNITAGISESIDIFEPTLLVESLFLYPKSTKDAHLMWSISQQTRLFNVFCSISTLTGIEYYSASRKRMRIFYDKSYIVAGPEGKIPLSDPVLSIAPEKSTLYAIQRDLTFGENRYRYNYEVQPEFIRFTQENLTTLHWGLVPLLGKGKLRTTVMVIDVEGYLLVYAISAAKTPLIPGLEGKMRDSFSNRADAIYGWFTKKADSIFTASSEK